MSYRYEKSIWIIVFLLYRYFVCLATQYSTSQEFCGTYEPLRYVVINTLLSSIKISVLQSHIQRAWGNYITQAP